MTTYEKRTNLLTDVLSTVTVVLLGATLWVERAMAAPPPVPAPAPTQATDDGPRLGIHWEKQPSPGPIPNTMMIAGASADGRIQCFFVISTAWKTANSVAGLVIDTPHDLSCVRN